MDGGAWWAAVHGVAKSGTRLSDFTFTFHSPALEKEMATHSSVLAWRIPGTGEPGGLLSMGSHRIRHDWRDLAAAAHIHVIMFWELNCYQSSRQPGISSIPQKCKLRAQKRRGLLRVWVGRRQNRGLKLGSFHSRSKMARMTASQAVK